MNTCTKVFLRKKEITGGRYSLYLDFYPAIRNPHTGRVSRRETLGIYIYSNPKNERERQFNATMEEKAEAIRCRRFEQLLNEQFDFLDKEKLKMDFLAYFKSKCRTKYQKWDCTLRHFEIYCKGQCRVGDLTPEFCDGFRQYLLSAKRQRNNGKGRTISNNSAAGYWSTFRALLKLAYKEKLIRENINDYLEKIEWKDVKKEFLTLDEVKLLAATPCKIPVLRLASLFSCLTGLRISDIEQLTWEHIEKGQDGYLIRIRTEKTETEANLPVSEEALEILGERSTGLVFKGLKRHMINHPLKAWLKEAGITRNVTFHSFRHTFATLQLAMGTDIFTVSKMLTHKNVSTTQIYAEVVNPSKRAAANAITLK